MWTQSSQNVTAMSPGRHLLECLLLGIALELRGAHGIDTRLLNAECFKPMLMSSIRRL